MTDHEQDVREFVECLGDTDRDEPLKPCPPTERCRHPDCRLANALLAMLNVPPGLGWRAGDRPVMTGIYVNRKDQINAAFEAMGLSDESTKL